MTKNQIDYWNLQETRRSNRAVEAETSRHNVATEGETNRHNVATEALDLGKLNETTRHNQATEGLGWANLNEAARHNVAQEKLTGMNLNLGIHQLAETQRHNIETEDLAWFNANSTNAVNAANEELTRVKTLWESALNNEKVALSAAQRRQIEKQIQVADSNVAKLQAETSKLNQDQAYKMYDTILSTVNSVSKLLDTLMPLAKGGN